MHRTLAIVLFLILAAAVHKTNANISLGACSLSCNENEHQAHDMLGQSCECPDHEELTAKVAALQAQFDDLKGRVRYVATGWTKASNDLYYKFFDENANYETANSKCASFGARLAAAGMRTAALRREIRNYFPTMNSYNTWIGLDDLVRQGSYVWSDGVNSTTGNTNWNPGQPNSSNERCACIRTDGKVWDSTCSRSLKCLCELSP